MFPRGISTLAVVCLFVCSSVCLFVVCDNFAIHFQILMNLARRLSNVTQCVTFCAY